MRYRGLWDKRRATVSERGLLPDRITVASVSISDNKADRYKGATPMPLLKGLVG